MKENCSFPFIQRGHLCLLPVVTHLLGVGLLNQINRINSAISAQNDCSFSYSVAVVFTH